MSQNKDGAPVVLNVQKPVLRHPEVTAAFLQVPTTWSGVFSSQTTLNSEKTPYLSLQLSDIGLILEVSDEKHAMHGHRALVPLANVKVALLK